MPNMIEIYCGLAKLLSYSKSDVCSAYGRARVYDFRNQNERRRRSYTAEKNVGVEFKAKVADCFQRRFGQAVVNLGQESVQRTFQLRQPEAAGAELSIEIVVDGSQPVDGAVVVVGPRRAAVEQPSREAEPDSEERSGRRRGGGPAASRPAVVPRLLLLLLLLLLEMPPASTPTAGPQGGGLLRRAGSSPPATAPSPTLPRRPVWVSGSSWVTATASRSDAACRHSVHHAAGGRGRARAVQVDARREVEPHGRTHVTEQTHVRTVEFYLVKYLRRQLHFVRPARHCK